MIYKFKSKACGDVIMLGASGDQMLRIIGKEPAAQGIIEVAVMPLAMVAIERAVAADEAARAQNDASQPPPRDGVRLHQRAWPLLEMMKRAHAAGNDIVWGV
jgi:riboflavin synthase